MESPLSSSALSVQTLLRDGVWVRALALSLVHDEHRADDLIQQTWVRALERPPSRAESHSGWIATVIRNLARDGWRRDSRRAARERASVRPLTSPSTADLVAKADAHRRLIVEVTRLAEPFRTVVLMRFFEDLPTKEIARRTGVPPATVRTRLHRAMSALRGELDRAEPGGWRLALGPFFGPVAGLTGGGAWTLTRKNTLVGGVLMTTTKKVTIAAAVLLLALLGGWQATRSADGLGEVAPVAEAVADQGPRRRPAAKARPVAAEEPVSVALPVVETPPDPVDDPSPDKLSYRIVREIPPPEPPPESVDGGKRVGISLGGGSGMTILPGNGNRWAPVPLRGSVTLSGTVTDGTGKPLEGAVILRVHLDEGGKPVINDAYRYEEFEDIGETDDDGHFEIDNQPAGVFLFMADWHGHMRDRTGLNLDGARSIAAKDGETVRRLDFRLPVSLADLGTVSGAIRGQGGQALGGVMVQVGTNYGDYARQDGTFTIHAVKPGTYTVRIRAAGYLPAEREVIVRGGGAVQADFDLELTLKGPLELVGRVVDRSGRPLVDAQVWYGSGAEDARSARTDADGVFHIRDLPQEKATVPTDVVVSPRKFPGEFTHTRKVGVTVPSPGLEIVVDRVVPLLLSLRDAATGDPVTLFSIDVQRLEVVDGAERRAQLMGISTFDDNGQTTLHLPAGTIRISVEAKDYVGVEIEVVIADLSRSKELTLELRSR